ncbi:hypothetical protein [Streptomyces sp. NPDC005281]
MSTESDLLVQGKAGVAWNLAAFPMGEITAARGSETVGDLA